MSISTDLSTLSLTDLSTLPLDTLLSKASFHLPHEPYLAIPYLNQALVLDTSSAPLHAQRAHAYVFLGDWAKAYFDACQGLDEYAEGLTDDLRAELVGLAGRCAVERAIWDLAVIHLEEAIGLKRTPAMVELQVKALSNLQKASLSPLRSRLLQEKKIKFLEEAFPGIEEDEEWESDEDGEDDVTEDRNEEDMEMAD